MSELGLQAAIQRVTATQPPASAPSFTRVELPVADPNRPKPKKAAQPLSSPRDMQAGTSPLATTALSDAYSGAFAVPEESRHGVPVTEQDIAERGSQQISDGLDLLPAKAGLVAYGPNDRNETVYLEQSRWDEHIKPAHITQEPQVRGKRTTTWWPVEHSATGARSMTEPQVVQTVMDAVRQGTWQNAPRGTRLAVYALPEQQANQYGVSEVKVSTAPDGRILSAYPSAGDNVLAVRETPDQSGQAGAQQAAAAVQQGSTPQSAAAASELTA